MNFSREATDACLAQKTGFVPGIHFPQRLDRGLGPKLRGGTAWSPDPQWFESSRQYHLQRKKHRCLESGVVQVSDEDLVQECIGIWSGNRRSADPDPMSKRNLSPLPSSITKQATAWAGRGVGIPVTHAMIRISLGSRSSLLGE